MPCSVNNPPISVFLQICDNASISFSDLSLNEEDKS